MTLLEKCCWQFATPEESLLLNTLLVSLHTCNDAFPVFGVFAAPSWQWNPVTPSCCSSTNPLTCFPCCPFIFSITLVLNRSPTGRTQIKTSVQSCFGKPQTCQCATANQISRSNHSVLFCFIYMQIYMKEPSKNPISTLIKEAAKENEV